MTVPTAIQCEFFAFWHKSDVPERINDVAFGTKLPFAALKTTSAFWGTAVEKCSL
jgi:hypothetical protein